MTAAVSGNGPSTFPVGGSPMSFSAGPNEFKYTAPCITANTSGTTLSAFSVIDGSNGIITPPNEFTSRPYTQIPAVISHQTLFNTTANSGVPGTYSALGNFTVNSGPYPVVIALCVSINAIWNTTYYLTGVNFVSNSTAAVYTPTFAAGGSYVASPLRYGNPWIVYYEFPAYTNDTFSVNATVGGSGTVGRCVVSVFEITNYTSPVPYATGAYDGGLSWTPTMTNQYPNSAYLASVYVDGASTTPTTNMSTLTGSYLVSESTGFWSGTRQGQNTTTSFNASAVFSAGTNTVGGWAIWR